MLNESIKTYCIILLYLKFLLHQMFMYHEYRIMNSLDLDSFLNLTSIFAVMGSIKLKYLFQVMFNHS